MKSPAGPGSVPQSTNLGPPPYEPEWEQSIAHLERRATLYQEADKKGQVSTEAEVEELAGAMRDVGDKHPDPEVRKDWHQKAKDFTRAGRKARRELLHDAKGLVGALISIPFVVVGTALHIVGGSVHAAGAAIG
ncbi:hypothetical protein C0991_002280, partial [Blastosporella zonata]